MLDLLTAVGERPAQSQRRLALDLGVALGVVNCYLKLCVRKGWVKVSEVPARRYAYYLTPKGASEKAKLSAQFLRDRFRFFRQAREECAGLLTGIAGKSRHRRIVLAGSSELSEIVILCAMEVGVDVVAIVDPGVERAMFAHVPVVASFEQVGTAFDAVFITNLKCAATAYEETCRRFGAERVIAPDILGLGRPAPAPARAGT